MAGEYTSKKIIITVTENGQKVYCSPWVRPASASEAGVIKVDGTSITIKDGVISTNLPTKLSDLTDDLGSSPVHTHKQYLTSVTAHNQASNTINAMTDYAKASEEASIATSDTLNSAVGKLEYKIDDVDTQLQALITMLDAAAK